MKKPLLFSLMFPLLASCGTVPQKPLSQTNFDKQTITQNFAQLSQQPLPNEWRKVGQNFATNPIKTLDCGELQSGKTIVLTGQNQIPVTCDLWQKNTHFVIQSSDTSLDCQGVAMSTGGSATNQKITAFAIQTPQAVSEKPVSENDTKQGIGNVQLNNCIAVGYGHGVLVEQALPANARYEQLLQNKTNRDEQRKLSPSHILLNRMLVADSKNSGIFIGDHVQDVTLANSRVMNAGTVGVYFEFGSRGNVVQDSHFSQNGIRQVVALGVKVGKPNREAIAIDSSQNNVIRRNRFDSNGGGGVFLYRNCFEHADDPSQPNHFLRVDGSNGNLIENNIFQNEPVGVWVASRQSRNLKGFACGAYPITSDLTTSYHLDDAEQNVVTHNTFDKVEKGIIIEDNNNVVSFNRFLAHVKQPMSVGSDIRELSSEGVVKGNQINKNTFANPRILQNIAFIGKSATANLHCDNMDKNGKKIDDVCLIN